jgi:serine/threonine protein kinase
MSQCRDLGILCEKEFAEKYKGIELLGQGAFGKVYKVVDTQNDKIVALKIVEHEDIFETDENGKIFEIDPSCNHESISKWTDGIIRIHEYGYLESGAYFYTMPVLCKIPKMNAVQELDFVFELLYTLVVLAQHGIAHRDISPDNILCKSIPYKRQYIINGRTYIINSNILPVLIDFGAVDFKAPKDRFSDYTLRGLIVEFIMQPTLTRLLSDKQIKRIIISRLKKSDKFDILCDPIFNSLVQTELEPGDIIKVFSPLVI